MNTVKPITTTIVAIIVFMFATSAAAQEPAAGSLEQIQVYGASLAGNLEGDPAERDVYVYLPPGYAADPDRRYPVVYNLHGYSIDAPFSLNALRVPEAINRALASGSARAMILVFPDARTLHDGSMYSSSVTTGDWEGFIVRDLVTYIDDHYRTIAEPAARGLSGHSMGGYGTLRIAMKHPEVFSSIYAMSSCCLSPRVPGPGEADLEQVTTVEQATAMERGPRTSMAAAAAWSPNPNRPPLYIDLATRDGEVQPQVVAQWAANSPLAMLPQYVHNLQTLAAIALDVGRQDFLLDDNQKMDALLTRFGIAHGFEIYEGDHVNRVAERFEQHLLPFFSRHLAF